MADNKRHDERSTNDTRRRFLQVVGGGSLVAIAGCAGSGGGDGGDTSTTEALSTSEESTTTADEATEPNEASTTTTEEETTSEETDEPTTSEQGYSTVRVPQDYSTVQEGVDSASEGDLILIDAGTYNESVAVSTSGLTLRGVDRNEVVFDGEFELSEAVDVEGAAGVALENFTVHSYTENAVYWDGVEGFRGSYLTAYNNGNYGIYAFESVDGRFEKCYASGHPDSGFYLGHNNPYHAIITDVTAENNALGFSGTAAGGDLTIENSVWNDNMAGIVPNTLDKAHPQKSIHMVNNEVRNNNNTDAPAKPLTYPALGTGILISGGNDNVVENNEVSDHTNFGIAVKQLADKPPANNTIQNNSVSGSGKADLALGKPTGEGNRFVDNDAETSLPEELLTTSDPVPEGTSDVDDVYTAQGQRGQQTPTPWGDWKEAPEPDDQPTMPNPEAAPVPAAKDASVDEMESS